MTTSASRGISPSNNPTSTLQTDVSVQSAAFQGAYHAFSLKSAATRPPHTTCSGKRGALAAASYASHGGQVQPQSSSDGVSFHNNASNRDISEPPFATRRPRSRASSTSTSQKAFSQKTQPRQQSHSHVAALLAASRAHTPPQGVGSSSRLASRRPSPLQSIYDTPLTASERLAETPSTSTKAIVQLFESRQLPVDNTPIAQTMGHTSRSTLQIRSPIPIGSKTSHSVLTETWPSALARSKSGTVSPGTTISLHGATAAAVRLASPAMEVRIGGASLAPPKHNVPRPPPPRRIRSPSDVKQGSNGPKPIQRGRRFSDPLQTPTANPAHSNADRNPENQTLPTDKLYAKAPSPHSHQSFSTVPPARLSPGSQLRRQPAVSRSLDKSHQTPHLPKTGTPHPPDSYVPQMTIESLADAMVASSLASSRAPSPSKSAPALPRRHGKPYLFHRNYSQEQMSRTPSPAKGMRQTMREPAKSDDEGDFRKRSHLIRKHPNKHHEGDRKRYRNQVTERERKRYEGVWAANKGLLKAMNDSANTVLNVAVRDIWRRSRLPDHVLEEVWDLVNLRDTDSLGREEFVVGMWLIDQRLKGNKLPIKVSESIWSSVRHLTGITVPRNTY